MKTFEVIMLCEQYGENTTLGELRKRFKERKYMNVLNVKEMVSL